MDLTKNIPFIIGMEYENWEFDLDVISNSNYYDKYKYIKDDVTHIFGIEVSEIFLFFSLDILICIEVLFKNNLSIEHYKSLVAFNRSRANNSTNKTDIFLYLAAKDKLKVKLEKLKVGELSEIIGVIIVDKKYNLW